MRHFKYIFGIVTLLICFSSLSLSAESTRKERRLINEGNSLYKESKFKEAESIYEKALDINANSAEARYNLALSQIRQVKNPADSSSNVKKLVDQAKKNFTEVASLASSKPGLAEKANFNLGNIEFNSKDFEKAIQYYKQALRIDPSDEKARKNLRIAQLNLQKQENQDQNKQDQDQDQNKDEKDQNKDQQNQNQQQQPDQPEQKKESEDLSNQTASQILQAIDNKEAATRAKVNKANTGEKAGAAGVNNRRW